MARRHLFLLLVLFCSSIFWTATRPAIGSVGNCSLKIYAGTNPVEEFAKAKLIQHPGGRVDIVVKLPNKTQFYILSDPAGFMPGWLATIDANDDVTVQSPDDLKYIYPEDANYMLTQIKDANDDNVVTFDYNDSDGNLIDWQSDGFDPNLCIEYKYDANGLLDEIIAHGTDANRTYTITYDDANKVTEVSGSSCPTCGGNGSVRYEYDPNGLLEKVRAADSNAVIYEYEYNDSNLVTVYLGPAGDANHIRKFSYTETGSGGYIVDTNDYNDATNYRVTREYRDSTGFVTKRIRYENLNEDPNDPDGASFVEHTVYIRDANNNVTRKVVIPPSANAADPPYPISGVRKEYTYDPNTGKVLKEKWYDANELSIAMSQYTYDYVLDSDGNILDIKVETYTDARGATTEYYYDNYEDVVPSLKWMPEVNEGISGVQRLKYTYKYDDRKRITRETQLDDSNNVLAQTRYQYDGWGNLIKRLDWDSNGVSESNEVTEYRYNGFNQMTRMILPSGVVSGKSYNDNGKLESEFTLAEPSDVNESEPNLVSQTKYYYDGNGRVKEIAKAVDDGVFDFNSPDSWIWTEYEYDLRGNKKKVIEDANGLELTTTYKYNNQGEVVQVTLPNGKWTKTYRDGRGLVTKTEVGYGGTSKAETTFEYDANGNLKWQTAPDGYKTRYDYDDYDRLIGVIKGL